MEELEFILEATEESMVNSISFGKRAFKYQSR
ncbi:MAG: hypothetical protein CM15mP102_14850 [Flavobacteriales bacterium]|nr:MAG: hypothetical protein CM15mP102_14850 [Flavobacteriales bacterium]